MLKQLRRLKSWWMANQVDADLREELEFHRSLKQLELESAGLPREQARQAQRREMGNATIALENSRAVWIWPWLESVIQDVRYTGRSLRTNPGFALTAILILASAISLNTSLFTVFNTLALKPWPVSHPEQVVKIYGKSARNAGPGGLAGFGLAEVRYFGEHAKSLAGVIAYQDDFRVTLDDKPGVVHFVNGSFFRTLGVSIARGRDFLDSEDRADAPRPVALLTYTAWQTRYGGDLAIVGHPIRVNGVPLTVVGVLSEDFTGERPSRADVYATFALTETLTLDKQWARTLLHDAGYCCVDVAGRLAPGYTARQSEAELALLDSQFRAAQKLEAREGVVITGTPLLEAPTMGRKKVLPVMFLMFGGVTLVLLLACANIGNLLLARATSRRREISVRLAIGASRSRVVRQLVTESLVLAAIAGVVGVGVAAVLPSWMVRNAIPDPVTMRFSPDLSVLLYTLALTVLSCLSFGLAPALHGTAGANAGSRDTITVRGLRLPFRASLLACQVAISITLLTAAGLVARGLQQARSQDPGFAIRDVSVVSIELPADTYDEHRVAGLMGELSSSLSRSRLASTYGMTMIPPLGRSRAMGGVRLPAEDRSKTRMALMHQVTSGYFDVLRIPVMIGRNFAEGDASRHVALVNESLARQLWPQQQAIGKLLVVDKPREVIGVVKDVYTTDLDRIEPTFYLPYEADFVPDLLVRGSSVATEGVRALLTRLEPRAQMRVYPLQQNLDWWLTSSRTGAAVAAMLGALALALASVGLFGIFAFVVQQRTKEIGLRRALGARTAQIVGFVFESHSKPVLAGVIAGFAGSLGASKLLESYLFGVSRFDPVAYIAVITILISSAALATWVPARRAVRVDPAVTLRHD